MGEDRVRARSLLFLLLRGGALRSSCLGAAAGRRLGPPEVGRGGGDRLRGVAPVWPQAAEGRLGGQHGLGGSLEERRVAFFVQQLRQGRGAIDVAERLAERGDVVDGAGLAGDRL